MPTDKPALYREIAEGLLYEMQQPSTAGALHDLNIQSKRPDSGLKSYSEWKKAINSLIDGVGAKIRDGSTRWPRPHELNPDGVAKLSDAQMNLLLAFSSTGPNGGERSVQSAKAKYFLNGFHKKFSPPFRQLLRDKALDKAAAAFTNWWSAHASTFLDMFKSDKSGRYLHYQSFVKPINEMADQPNFASGIGIGLCTVKDFKADPEKLAQWAKSSEVAADAANAIHSKLINIAQLANTLKDTSLAQQVEKARLAFIHTVKPALHDYQQSEILLTEANQARTGAGRQWL